MAAPLLDALATGRPPTEVALCDQGEDEQKERHNPLRVVGNDGIRERETSGCR
jgi:hypothetical protein